jgi:hypothetical protein
VKKRLDHRRFGRDFYAHPVQRAPSPECGRSDLNLGAKMTERVVREDVKREIDLLSPARRDRGGSRVPSIELTQLFDEGLQAAPASGTRSRSGPRGLADPLLVVTDGAPGLIRAVEICFPRALRQRCSIASAISAAKRPRACGPTSRARPLLLMAGSPALAAVLHQDFVAAYERDLPAVVQCFQDDHRAGFGLTAAIRMACHADRRTVHPPNPYWSDWLLKIGLLQADASDRSNFRRPSALVCFEWTKDKTIAVARLRNFLRRTRQR